MIIGRLYSYEVFLLNFAQVGKDLQVIPASIKIAFCDFSVLDRLVEEDPTRVNYVPRFVGSVRIDVENRRENPLALSCRI